MTPEALRPFIDSGYGLAALFLAGLLACWAGWFKTLREIITIKGETAALLKRASDTLDLVSVAMEGRTGAMGRLNDTLTERHNELKALFAQVLAKRGE